MKRSWMAWSSLSALYFLAGRSPGHRPQLEPRDTAHLLRGAMDHHREDLPYLDTGVHHHGEVASTEQDEVPKMIHTSYVAQIQDPLPQQDGGGDHLRTPGHHPERHLGGVVHQFEVHHDADDAVQATVPGAATVVVEAEVEVDPEAGLGMVAEGEILQGNVGTALLIHDTQRFLFIPEGLGLS